MFLNSIGDMLHERLVIGVQRDVDTGTVSRSR